MVSSATLRHLRISPRKVRLLADMVRGRNIEEALNVLQFTQKRSSLPLAKLIKSAAANADQKGGVNLDKLFISKIFVDGGPTMHRYMPRAQGRATPIIHRTSHVTVELASRD